MIRAYTIEGSIALKERFVEIWHTISYLGTAECSDVLLRHIVLCNRTAMVVIASSATGAIFRPAVPHLVTGFVVCMMLGVVTLLLNYFNKVFASRVLLTIGLASTKLMMQIPALKAGIYEEIYFFDKIVAFPIGILPILLFTFSKRDSVFMSVAVAVNICTLIFYDTILEGFGMGYYQQGFTMAGYSNLHFDIFMCFACVLLCFFFLKRQNEISIQSNRLLISHLQRAKATIESQNRELNERSESLEVLVQEKTKHLQKINNELSGRVEEMNQFSYAVSHHLRGPLASLKGLVHLLELEVKSEAVTMVKQSAEDLDNVIHDLNHILLLKEKKISFEAIKVRQLTEAIVKKFSMLQQTEFQLNFKDEITIFSNASWINDILRELISNSIKFKMDGRTLKIAIRSYVSGDSCMIEFADNGMGFASEKVQSRLFQMFQRYHDRISGRGLGLYLVAFKVRLLNGQIQMVSKPFEGTRIILQLPRNIDAATVMPH